MFCCSFLVWWFFPGNTPEHSAGYSGIQAVGQRNTRLEIHKTVPDFQSTLYLAVLDSWTWTWCDFSFYLFPETLWNWNTFYFIFYFSKWSPFVKVSFLALHLVWYDLGREGVSLTSRLGHVCFVSERKQFIHQELAPWRGILILGMAFCMCRKTVKTFPMGRDRTNLRIT